MSASVLFIYLFILQIWAEEGASLLLSTEVLLKSSYTRNFP